MDERAQWRSRDWACLFAVFVGHGILISLLLNASTRGALPSRHAGAPHAIELLLLPVRQFPRERVDSTPLRRPSVRVALAVEAPMMQSPLSAMTRAAAAPSDGQGLGVDWAAEARRAKKAFDIRQATPSVNESVSTDPAGDTWWPKGPHQAGQPYKTPSGDWIVWLNANCYRLVGAGKPTAAQLGAAQWAAMPPDDPRIVCLEDKH